MFKYLGTSTASHQIEGETHNDWERWELANAERLAKEFDKNFNWLPKDIFDRVKKYGRDPKNYISDKVIDHYHKYKEDLSLLPKLGLNSYRFSIEWARVEPERGKYSEEGIEFYKNIIRELKKLNITPFITLWHFTNPTWVVDSGWLFNKENQEAFLKYAEKIISELKEVNPEIKFVMTFNEPGVFTGASFFAGIWVLKKSFIKGIRALFIFPKMHNRTYDLLKRKYPDLQVSYAKNMGLLETGYKNKFLSLIFIPMTKLYLWLADFMFVEMTKRHIDWLGINFYYYSNIRYFIKYLTSGRKYAEPGRKVNDMGWWLQPDKIGDLLIQVWNRYHLPIVITENGLADSEDIYREWFIEETMKSLRRAEKSGVDVQGYLHWSLLDNFEWDKGYWPKFGLVSVDVKTGKRSIRKSAYSLVEYAKKYLTFKNSKNV